MQEAVFESVSQYIFGGLFVWLLWYVLQHNKEREVWLKTHLDGAQEINKETVSTLKLMKVEIKNDLADIKQILQKE